MERLAMADDRALEEEAMRMNPVNPKKLLPAERKGAGRMVGGAGATPSMGLSQFRGGRTRKMPKLKVDTHPHESDEAHEMGRHLGAHLLSLHGSGFHERFLEGMNMGNQYAPDGLMGGAKSGAYEGQGMYGSMAGGSMMGDAFRAMAGLGGKSGANKLLSGSEDLSKTMMNTGIKKVRGGRMRKQTHQDKVNEKLGEEVSQLHEDLHKARGGAKRVKKPVLEGDGRRKRAEVVKKVMREKGLKMIEASKYVKEHGLY
jgi:hypothetical protein